MLLVPLNYHYCHWFSSCYLNKKKYRKERRNRDKLHLFADDAYNKTQKRKNKKLLKTLYQIPSAGFARARHWRGRLQQHTIINKSRNFSVFSADFILRIKIN